MCASTFIIRESGSKSDITFKFSTVDMNFNFINLVCRERVFEIYSELLPRLHLRVLMCRKMLPFAQTFLEKPSKLLKCMEIIVNVSNTRYKLTVFTAF